MSSSIFSFLPFRDLISFEQTNQVHHAGVSERNWKQKRIAERYTFEWKMSRGEQGKTEKWNYGLTKALVLFLEKFPNCTVPSNAIDLYQKYFGLAEKFPLLGSYVQGRLLPTMKRLIQVLSQQTERPLWMPVFMDTG